MATLGDSATWPLNPIDSNKDKIVCPEENCPLKPETSFVSKGDLMEHSVMRHYPKAVTDPTPTTPSSNTEELKLREFIQRIIGGISYEIFDDDNYDRAENDLIDLITTTVEKAVKEQKLKDDIRYHTLRAKYQRMFLGGEEDAKPTKAYVKKLKQQLANHRGES